MRGFSPETVSEDAPAALTSSVSGAAAVSGFPGADPAEEPVGALEPGTFPAPAAEGAPPPWMGAAAPEPPGEARVSRRLDGAAGGMPRCAGWATMESGTAFIGAGGA